MTKSKRANLLILVFLLSSCTCGDGIGSNDANGRTVLPGPPDSQVDRYQPRDSQKPEQVLVYIDLTSSIRPESIERIGAKLKAVLLKLPRGSVASIRLVERNLLVESPFLPIESPTACVVEESENERKRVEAQKECDDASKPYIDKVNEIVARVQTVRPKKDVSCIIDTLESAHDFFKVSPKGSTFRLIYFSDMIQQCPSDSIFICSKTGQPKRDDIMARLEEKFRPTFNLERVVGKNVSIIITASDNPSYNCLSLSEAKEFWLRVFSKVGYENLDIADFNFTQEIPDSLRH